MEQPRAAMSRALSFGNQEDPAAPAAMRYESTLSDVVVMEGPALLCHECSVDKRPYPVAEWHPRKNVRCVRRTCVRYD